MSAQLTPSAKDEAQQIVSGINAKIEYINSCKYAQLTAA